MLRGIYTGASGMTAMQVKMDTVANNLANVDKTAFKEDVTIFKANPEVLIHRTRDDGVGWVDSSSDGVVDASSDGAPRRRGTAV